MLGEEELGYWLQLCGLCSFFLIPAARWFIYASFIGWETKVKEIRLEAAEQFSSEFTDSKSQSLKSETPHLINKFHANIPKSKTLQNLKS